MQTYATLFSFAHSTILDFGPDFCGKIKKSNFGFTLLLFLDEIVEDTSYAGNAETIAKQPLYRLCLPD